MIDLDRNEREVGRLSKARDLPVFVWLDFSAALPNVTSKLRACGDSPHVSSELVIRNLHRHHVGRVTHR